MAECINCGAYTKFEKGLCYNCYKKDDSSTVDNSLKEIDIEPIVKKDVKEV